MIEFNHDRFILVALIRFLKELYCNYTKGTKINIIDTPVLNELYCNYTSLTSL